MSLSVGLQCLFLTIVMAKLICGLSQSKVYSHRWAVAIHSYLWLGDHFVRNNGVAPAGQARRSFIYLFTCVHYNKSIICSCPDQLFTHGCMHTNPGELVQHHGCYAKGG